MPRSINIGPKFGKIPLTMYRLLARNLFVIWLVLAAVCLCGVADAVAQVRVRGYTRKDGTYVRPHYRSRPDGNFYNNWSTYGNVNPRCAAWRAWPII